MGNPVAGDVRPTEMTRCECDLIRPNLTICSFLEHCLCYFPQKNLQKQAI